MRTILETRCTQFDTVHRWLRVFAKSSKAVLLVTSASTTTASRAKPGSQQQQLPYPYFEFEYLSVCIHNRTGKTSAGVGEQISRKTKHRPPRFIILIFSCRFGSISGNEERLRELVESPIVRNYTNSSERKLKEFFMACLHDYGRYKEGGYVLVDVINKHLGGWYPKVYNLHLHVTESIALIIYMYFWGIFLYTSGRDTIFMMLPL